MAHALGILGTDSGHHPAAALVVDGELVAFAEEERFTRNKAGLVDFPDRAVQYCLQAGGLRPEQLDRVAYGWACDRYRSEMPLRFFAHRLRYRSAGGHADGWFRGLRWLVHHRPGWVTDRLAAGLRRAGLRGAMPPVSFHDHHRCHAASAHLLSGFERSAALILDGSGEELGTSGWACDGLSLQRRFGIEVPNSLGWFYAAFTEYLGFVPYQHEGKLMGLAAYGQPRDELLRSVGELVSADGSWVSPATGKYGPRSTGEHFGDELIRRFGPPRVPGSELTRRHQDLAWAVQDRLETAACSLARRALRAAGADRLVVAGGVGLNCKMNGRLARLPECAELFVQPAADDSGAALGAALIAAVELGDDPRAAMKVDMGPGFDDVHATLRACGVRFEQVDAAAAAAELLAEGAVVGWFQGRMECGARALGHRSILANPADPAMKDRVNQRVKLRETWRPYAPSMTREAAARVLGEDADRPFMVVAHEATEEAKAALPSVVHVDGTVRPQTVELDREPRYHALLEQLGQRTGWPVALNTSFNVRGEPIVCTPRDALRTYFATGMDALVIGDFLLRKDR